MNRVVQTLPRSFPEDAVKTLSHSLAAAAVAAALTLAPGDAAAQNADQCWVQGGDVASTADRPSPMGVVSIPMGDQEATLCYGRPSARGRSIMGGLVPFGRPWRLGANESTQIHLPFAAEIGGRNGVQVEPGSYSIYVIPGEDEWEFVINEQAARWGVPINADVRAGDVGSVTRSVARTDDPVEQFTVSWDPHGEMMGHLVMEWENTRVELPIHHGSMRHE
jgi:hypothetical protein